MAQHHQTHGSITSSVSANTTAGFSIVSYTGNATSGATVGHGLGSTPKMIIARKRNGAENWLVYNEAIGNSNILLLNGTDASFADTIWTSSPTSSVFSIHSVDGINGSGNTYIAYYCLQRKKATASSEATQETEMQMEHLFIQDLKPSWLMYKRTDTTGSWEMWDNKRSTFNPENKALFCKFF